MIELTSKKKNEV